MRLRTTLLLMILAMALCQPHLFAAHAEVTTEVNLYAHTDPTATSVNGRVLTIAANATSRQSQDVREGLDFTLVPSLSAPLHLFGGIDVYVWLSAQESVRATLQVAILEVAANSSLLEIRSASVTVSLPSSPYLVIFGLGVVDYTIAAGSTLRFEISVSPARALPVRLLWDSPSTATRLVIRVESVPRLDLRIIDTHGRSSIVFSTNDTGLVQLYAEVIVEDPFHGTNVRTVSLNVTNSSGGFVVKDVPMNLTSQTEVPFRLKYGLPITAPPGRYNVTVSVMDVAGRTFSTSREILVTRFYTLMIMLIDSQKRPAPNLSVSVYADDELLGEVTTNSTGRASVRVPSTQEVGPLRLEIRENATLLLIGQIEVESDSTVQLEVPLYDWDIVVRLETLDLPLSDTVVRLYLNGALVASAKTDLNGMARFTSLPLGTYEVAAESILGSRRFENVTHSSQSPIMLLRISVLPGIPESTVLIATLLALFAIFGVIAVRRERARTRRFKHVAELLGGRIPESAVIMIAGPSGAGKTLLLNNILAELRELDRPCLYISNSEVPSRIREQISRLGVDVRKSEKQNQLRFIDSYSSEAGAVSSEKHTVASLNDLTALGIEITRCTDELGTKADVFLDSITPIITSADAGRALNFIRHYGSRATQSGGNFTYTIGTTIDTHALARFEEASDCVFQMEKSLGPRKIFGRLLIKKARGVAHEQDWLNLRVNNKGKLEFLAPPNH